MGAAKTLGVALAAVVAVAQPAEAGQRKAPTCAKDDLQRRRRTIGTLTGYTQFSLAVTRNGAAAWLTPATPGPQRLNVVDRGGLRVLDSGTIAPTSLTAETSLISWLRDGAERFARMH